MWSLCAILTELLNISSLERATQRMPLRIQLRKKTLSSNYRHTIFLLHSSLSFVFFLIQSKQFVRRLNKFAHHVELSQYWTCKDHTKTVCLSSSWNSLSAQCQCVCRCHTFARHLNFNRYTFYSMSFWSANSLCFCFCFCFCIVCYCFHSTCFIRVKFIRNDTAIE